MKTRRYWYFSGGVSPRSLVLFPLVCLLFAGQPAIQAAEEDEYDLVIYGGTSGGVAAAVQAARMDKSVVVIEPGRRLGGLSSGGLGQTDIGNKAAIGGISREFYRRINEYYQDPDHWDWQEPEDYRSGGQSRTREGEDTMWTFEPSAALEIFNDFIREEDIPVVYEERLNRDTGVEMERGKIVSITMESGRTFHGKMFIDATYEGDLLAAAGVSYIVGREGNDRYDETLNGVQTRHAVHHQLKDGIDPYVKKGDPSSGLLPFIDPTGPGEEGGRDHRVQAYCFRMCLTDHPDNRIPFKKPAGYDELDYELALRNFEAGEDGMPWINSKMPNRKTDTNNRTGYSTDFIGQNYAYPEANYAERERIIERHRKYQQGLMWTLANHPRVPEHIRNEVSRWGTCKDEFARADGWQQQLYIREARRMIGDYVMTQHHCQGRELAPQPVGLAAYTMDSHNTQRYVDENGHARNEGDVQVGGFPPYPIAYRSLIPKAEECSNLLVPVCLSASHIAYGSIRMEPVFMVLGQSAATAACLAVEDGVSVQDVHYDRLRERLLADKQRLEWQGGRAQAAAAIRLEDLNGLVADDSEATLKGSWLPSTVVGPFVGNRYLHDDNTGQGDKSARFELTIPRSGRYEVRLAYTPHGNRAGNVPVTIESADGTQSVRVDQRKTPDREQAFASLGVYHFKADQKAVVTLSNRGANGYVIADAVQLVPKD